MYTNEEILNRLSDIITTNKVEEKQELDWNIIKKDVDKIPINNNTSWQHFMLDVIKIIEKHI